MKFPRNYADGQSETIIGPDIPEHEARLGQQPPNPAGQVAAPSGGDGTRNQGLFLMDPQIKRSIQ